MDINTESITDKLSTEHAEQKAIAGADLSALRTAAEAADQALRDGRELFANLRSPGEDERQQWIALQHDSQVCRAELDAAASAQRKAAYRCGELDALLGASNHAQEAINDLTATHADGEALVQRKASATAVLARLRNEISELEAAAVAAADAAADQEVERAMAGQPVTASRTPKSSEADIAAKRTVVAGIERKMVAIDEDLAAVTERAANASKRLLAARLAEAELRLLAATADFAPIAEAREAAARAAGWTSHATTEIRLDELEIRRCAAVLWSEAEAWRPGRTAVAATAESSDGESDAVEERAA